MKAFEVGLKYLTQSPPSFQDLWTYCGIWILGGIIIGLTSIMIRSLGLDITRELSILAATPLALVILWWMLKSLLACSITQAFLVSSGGILIAFAFWPTIRLDYVQEWYLAFPMALVGVLLSLPIFSKYIKVQREKGFP